MRFNSNKEKIIFQDEESQKVIGSFDGGEITSDAGGLLLREIENSRKILKRFSDCFTDYRKWKEYSVEELISQRVYGLILGYEDLNDHDELRNDPTLKVLVGNKLAGKSTLNRLELTPEDANEKTKYKKISFNENKIKNFIIEVFIDGFKKPPKRLVLDFDATDDTIHGNQEGKYYSGYYGDYCYLPLYIFCGDDLLCAKLRMSDVDGAFGTKEELERIVKRLREVWPDVIIEIRADGGYCRDEIMTWCEQNDCGYYIGLPKNDRLLRMIESEMEEAKELYQKRLIPVRIFKSFRYRTLDSWSRERNVIAKAEHLKDGANPRFIVTSEEPFDDGKYIYERIYCKRGEMENRIKEQKRDLFSGRTSTGKFRANQLRLWFSSVAYVLLNELRKIGLKYTELANAECSTIRSKILKLGACVFNTCKQVSFHFSSSYPFQELFNKILRNIRKEFA